MDSADLAHRFAYHPPATEDAHGRVRQRCHKLADTLNDQLPDGREKSLAITHLEETMFWANAALARAQEG